MIHVIATVTALPGKRDAWLAEFRKNQPHVLAEDGCHRYDVFVPIDTGLPGGGAPSTDTAVILETWTSPEHLRTHLAQPHMQRYKEAVQALVAGPTAIQVLGDAP